MFRKRESRPLSDKNTTRALYGCYKALVVSLQSPCSARTRPLYENERTEGGRERLLPRTGCKSKNFFLYVLFIFCPFAVNVFLFLSVCVFFSIFAEICIGGSIFFADSASTKDGARAPKVHTWKASQQTRIHVRDSTSLRNLRYTATLEAQARTTSFETLLHTSGGEEKVCRLL